MNNRQIKLKTMALFVTVSVLCWLYWMGMSILRIIIWLSYLLIGSEKDAREVRESIHWPEFTVDYKNEKFDFKY